MINASQQVSCTNYGQLDLTTIFGNLQTMVGSQYEDANGNVVSTLRWVTNGCVSRLSCSPSFNSNNDVKLD